ncbi:lipoprotein [Fictibacillus macauensis ZFHKF-1]|uniref:Lipoprotein n=1 Tax=Fictibacillus macauensis ZFHKF-1 TaxID=1196324 RepID=I8IXS1_9BACL|nr:DUF1672 family protein [Fictibacillus macauensis]EIT84286.1 lipoprotein [Fictibacillus macauensis ZFHKF-1]
MNNQAKENGESRYISVQDYTGQGYELHNGEEYVEFAKEHWAEVEKLVKAHFRNKYRSDVIVHNVVGAQDAVVAKVEAVEEPKYHTSVIVPIDSQSNHVTGKVVEDVDLVSSSIVSSYYGVAYKQKFTVLDDFCSKIVAKYPVVGMSQTAINKTTSIGLHKPYYFVSDTISTFPEVYQLYKKNGKLTNDEVVKFVRNKKHDELPSIALTFYMKKQHSRPDEKLLKMVIKEFKQTKGFPPGSYGIVINSNDIQKATAIGKSNKSNNIGEDDLIIK